MRALPLLLILAVPDGDQRSWLLARHRICFATLLRSAIAFARVASAISACETSPRAPPSVIPNWNGKDLLEKYLPSVVAALAGNPANEIIVVDNGSTDGSAEFVRTAFRK